MKVTSHEISIVAVTVPTIGQIPDQEHDSARSDAKTLLTRGTQEGGLANALDVLEALEGAEAHRQKMVAWP